MRACLSAYGLGWMGWMDRQAGVCLYMCVWPNRGLQSLYKPTHPQPAPTGLPLPKDPSLCPLCKQPRANPAVSPAGIAYCYRCLLAHVREAGAFCPVTLHGCSEEQVRRVYLS